MEAKRSMDVQPTRSHGPNPMDVFHSSLCPTLQTMAQRGQLFPIHLILALELHNLSTGQYQTVSQQHKP